MPEQDIEHGNGIGMKMNRFTKIYLCLAVLLLLLLGASASAETTVTFSPEKPKMGEYVDVTVTPGREGAVGVRYELSTSKGVVFKDKDKKTTKHYTASFRPGAGDGNPVETLLEKRPRAKHGAARPGA